MASKKNAVDVPLKVFELINGNYNVIRNSVHGVFLLGLVLVVVSRASEAFAGGTGSGNYAPEISPSAASSALAVLAGSGLMLAERLRIRRK